MKRKITHLLILAAALTGAACGEQTAPSQTGGRAEAIVAELHDPASKKVLVVSHRGDWRNWPENSIPAIESVIRMGVRFIFLPHAVRGTAFPAVLLKLTAFGLRAIMARRAVPVSYTHLDVYKRQPYTAQRLDGFWHTEPLRPLARH